MQYSATSPKDYIAQLDDDWRKTTLKKVRQLIINNAQDLSESIEYKMLAFQADGKSVFHLNAQKHYVSLYVGDIQRIDASGALLKELDLGKGCIRVKKNVDVLETDLDTFIIKAIAHWRSGGDVGC